MSRLSVSIAALSLSLAACSFSQEEESSEEVVVQPAPSPAPAAAASAMPADVRAALLAGFPDERAPDEFRAILETTKGPIEVLVHRAWAPLGADRFYTLVKHGYFTDIAFFRVVPDFMAQFGMAADPAINRVWSARTLMDEPVLQSNTRGRITFAKTGAPNSRSNQFFINYGDNGQSLDGQGFSPFGEVRNMSAADAVFPIGNGPPSGPDQGSLGARGNSYLRAEFPQLDYIRSARIAD